MFEIVEFQSCGVALRGKLYVPHAASQPLPAIVMTHGFSATISGMVADRYAEVFCEAGFVVLLYDHYSFGLSEGTPRFQINTWIQARGYWDATDYLVARPEVDPDRIAIWGDSMSGGEVLVVGASDERVKAIIAQVPACGDELPSHPPDGESFEAIRDTIRNPDLGAVARQVGEPMPVVSADQIGTPSLLTPITAYRWFIEYGGRYGTGWVNHAHDTVIETTAPYDRYLCASQLSVPTLMMVAREDEMPGANSVVARQVYDSIPAPKELIPLEGGHFGLLYHPGVLFDEASRSQRDFLKEYL